MKTSIKTMMYVESEKSTPSDTGVNAEVKELYLQLERIYGPWQADVLMQRYVEDWDVSKVQEDSPCKKN